MKLVNPALLILMLSFLTSCLSSSDENTVWIYTSLYKDTIADIEPQLQKQFPDTKFRFYQAGSEEVAGKIYAESLAGRIQADIVIASDRFWYEDMAAQGHLESYLPQGSDKILASYRHPEGRYSVVSFPIMVIAYNSDVVTVNEAPKTFRELTEPKWKHKVSMGSPLASGTSFTTAAVLLKLYGWEYFEALRKNELIAEGGNSGVIRRIQSKERPVGIVLLENVLRLTKSDPRIKFLTPADGAITQFNIMGLIQKKRPSETVRRIADWFFSEAGQKAMIKSYMYSPLPDFAAPEYAPSLKDILKNAKPWSEDFIKETMSKREFIKEEFSRIIY